MAAMVDSSVWHTSPISPIVESGPPSPSPPVSPDAVTPHYTPTDLPATDVIVQGLPGAARRDRGLSAMLTFDKQSNIVELDNSAIKENSRSWGWRRSSNEDALTVTRTSPLISPSGTTGLFNFLAEGPPESHDSIILDSNATTPRANSAAPLPASGDAVTASPVSILSSNPQIALLSSPKRPSLHNANSPSRTSNSMFSSALAGMSPSKYLDNNTVTLDSPDLSGKENSTSPKLQPKLLSRSPAALSAPFSVSIGRKRSKSKDGPLQQPEEGKDQCSDPQYNGATPLRPKMRRMGSDNSLKPPPTLADRLYGIARRESEGRTSASASRPSAQSKNSSMVNLGKKVLRSSKSARLLKLSLGESFQTSGGSDERERNRDRLRYRAGGISGMGLPGESEDQRRTREKAIVDSWRAWAFQYATVNSIEFQELAHKASESSMFTDPFLTIAEGHDGNGNPILPLTTPAVPLLPLTPYHPTEYSYGARGFSTFDAGPMESPGLSTSASATNISLAIRRESSATNTTSGQFPTMVNPNTPGMAPLHPDRLNSMSLVAFLSDSSVLGDDSLDSSARTSLAPSNPFLTVRSRLGNKMFRDLMVELIQNLGALLDARHYVNVTTTESPTDPLQSHAALSKTLQNLANAHSVGELGQPDKALVKWLDEELHHMLEDVDDSCGIKGEFSAMVHRGGYIAEEEGFKGVDAEVKVKGWERMLIDLEEMLWGGGDPVPEDLPYPDIV